MKKRLILVFIVLCIILIGIFYNSSKNINNIITNNRIKRYGQPINIQNGEINNEYFEIDDSGANAFKTTKGLNQAIKYAQDNNIEYIKLKKGNYCIISDEGNIGEKGIILKSNMTLDLNGSLIYTKETNAEMYDIFSISNVENVSLINGNILGDRDNHIYDNGSHQWGMGIRIESSNNITINNVFINNMTGDGIYITKIKKLNNSSNINIKNCNIYMCRRQGISIISGDNIKINGCEIHDIYGRDPQAGIDLESNLNEEIIKDVYISNNVLYNFGNEYSIKIQKNVDSVYIASNEIRNGSILSYDSKIETKISNNNICDGNIIFYNNDNFNNQGRILKNIIIEDNNITNGYIQVHRGKNAKVSQNNLINGYIDIVSTNTILTNNSVKVEVEEQEFAYNIRARFYKDIFYVYKLNNKVYGNVLNNEVIEDSKYINITDDINKIM